MKAMILAAGLGTRLLPLTEKRPKPLFPILDRPLIDILIRRLERSGCEAVIINTHHLAHMIDEFVEMVQHSSGIRKTAERRPPAISKGIGGQREAASLIPGELQSVKAQPYGIPVVTRYEPTILGTGGAIKNVEDFWNDEPFLVINGDIFTNIDLGEVYRFHLNHKHPVTLVLHDCPPFNHVWVDQMDHVTGFGVTEPCPPSRIAPLEGARRTAERRPPATSTKDNGIPTKGIGGQGEAVLLAPDLHEKRQEDAGEDYRRLAFTGIHVLDPQVLSFIPKAAFYSIIDAYCEMIRDGLTIKGFIARNHYWHDIGTMAGYQKATKEALARKALQTVFSEMGSDALVWTKLKGDGSDRTWYRVFIGATDGARETAERRPTAISAEDNGIPVKGIGGRREAVSLAPNSELLSLEHSSVIFVDHGPPPEDGTCEADAFFAIGQHLHNKGLPVPCIYGYDRSSGLVALEDLGDLHLQTVIRRTGDPAKVVAHYRNVIDLLIAMGVEGAKGFDPRYTYQTPCYDRELILERESKYFVEAFLNEYLGLKIDFEDLMEEFDVLAQRALDHPYTGLLHRDFQSRNILVKDGNYYFIDFQGARLGPLPYDLSSLLIDPYVALPQSLQDSLLSYYLNRLSDFIAVDASEFLDAYAYCAMNRNLQILGAFGFLSRIKGKKDFEAYIPPALASLKARLHSIKQRECPKLSRIIEGI